MGRIQGSCCHARSEIQLFFLLFSSSYTAIFNRYTLKGMDYYRSNVTSVLKVIQINFNLKQLNVHMLLSLHEELLILSYNVLCASGGSLRK